MPVDLKHFILSLLLKVVFKRRTQQRQARRSAAVASSDEIHRRCILDFLNILLKKYLTFLRSFVVYYF
ncbi:hypothetical protein SAMN05421736_104163 [Evansella caseinilytica]|uniref:Uncharacterized protein n=1 Tax=Evansella caseinilytica TaxID=1503961 RepID=A0A1H3NQE1_9BACI|nr:hypothetical protein SAMN05421736_104163 [Evansella caseinilytica]